MWPLWVAGLEILGIGILFWSGLMDDGGFLLLCRHPTPTETREGKALAEIHLIFVTVIVGLCLIGGAFTATQREASYPVRHPNCIPTPSTDCCLNGNIWTKCPTNLDSTG
jgi:hypothetical protein